MILLRLISNFVLFLFVCGLIHNYCWNRRVNKLVYKHEEILKNMHDTELKFLQDSKKVDESSQTILAVAAEFSVAQDQLEKALCFGVSPRASVVQAIQQSLTQVKIIYDDIKRRLRVSAKSILKYKQSFRSFSTHDSIFRIRVSTNSITSY